MYESLRPTTVQLGTLADGDKGTMQTLGVMRRLARDGAKDLAVRETAISVLESTRARAHDTMAELCALYRYVRDRVRFTRDIVNVETLQSPRYTLKVMSGDCDDRATLLAALCMSVGIPCRLNFKVVAANPRTNQFSHVYVTANVNGREIGMDPTYHSNAFGWQLRGMRSAEVPV